MDYSPPGSSAHGILQARILEWLAIPFSRGSSQPRGRIQVSSNCRQILYRLSHQGSPATVESQWTSFWHVWGCVFGSQEIHQWIYTHIYMYTHIYTHSLSRSQGEQMFLPAFFFFYDTNLIAYLYHHHYCCYFVSFCYRGYCLACEVNFWPLGCWKSYHYQSSASPVFPTPTHFKPWSMIHLELGNWWPLLAITSRLQILSLLFYICISVCTAALLNPRSASTSQELN